ncbi:MAG: four helix bundle protein, partial [Clostridia bacterium]|nr:four helix bundle protein [Clostridia bacterium]
ISLKETAETEYWLRLLVMSEYITEAEGESLINDCLEIKRILVATLNTAKQNNN